MLSRERLVDLISYEPITGIFTWRVAPRGVKPGKPCGHLTAHGYLTIRIDKRPYYAHRLAWLYMTGEWPSAEVDHINRNSADNRWANLRSADRRGNVANRTRRRDNRSGHKGVYLARSGRFTAQVRINGKAVHLGTFDTAAEATAKRDEVARQLYGEYYPD